MNKILSLEKTNDFTKKWFPLIAFISVVVSMLWPSQITSVVKIGYVNWIAGLIMFCMGLTLKSEDFRLIFTRPKALIAGILAQFIVMPLIAYGINSTFALEAGIALGFIIIGSCPGGVSSNVITYFAKGDVALSVSLTAVTTLLAPVVTPALVLLFASESIEVGFWSMFFSIIELIIVPILAGALLNFIFPKIAQKIAKLLPLISSLSVYLLIFAVVSANQSRLLSGGLVIILAVVLLSTLGYATGLLASKVVRLDCPQTTALSIEIGMKHFVLAVSLANTFFAAQPEVAVAGAIMGPWMIFSGAVYASIINRVNKLKETRNLNQLVSTRGI